MRTGLLKPGIYNFITKYYILIFCRINGPRPKVDSWLKNNDSTFEISGKKIHVEGSSELDEKAGKTSETQQHGTIIVRSRVPGDSSATKTSTETKDTSSINLVVGTGCFKKDKETRRAKLEDATPMMNDTRDLTDSNSEMTDFVTAWLVLVDFHTRDSFTLAIFAPISSAIFFF